MKKGLSIFWVMQVLFSIITFVGLILLLIGKIDNAGLSIIGMVFSLIFGNLYNSSKENHFEKNKKQYILIFAGIILLSIAAVTVFIISVLQ